MPLRIRMSLPDTGGGGDADGDVSRLHSRPKSKGAARTSASGDFSFWVHVSQRRAIFFIVFAIFFVCFIYLLITTPRREQKADSIARFLGVSSPQLECRSCALPRSSAVSSSAAPAPGSGRVRVVRIQAGVSARRTSFWTSFHGQLFLATARTQLRLPLR